MSPVTHMRQHTLDWNLKVLPGAMLSLIAQECGAVWTRKQSCVLNGLH